VTPDSGQVEPDVTSDPGPQVIDVGTDTGTATDTDTFEVQDEGETSDLQAPADAEPPDVPIIIEVSTDEGTILDQGPEVFEDVGVECGETVPCPEPFICEGSEALDCDDSDPCTIDQCDTQIGCEHQPACPEDIDLCTIESCVALPAPHCISEPVECVDESLCTVDSCDPETGTCTFVESVTNNPACDDNDLCTTDLCITACIDADPEDPESGECEQLCVHEPVVCVNTELCTTNTCNPLNGACLPGPTDCADDDDCTIDTCDGLIGCVHDIFPCDDGNICTVDACVPSDLPLEDLCVHAPIGLGVEECADDDPCTEDFCNATTNECEHQTKTCIDGVACTEDSCDALTGNCINDASAAGCDDSDPCTADSCEGSGCTHEPIVCHDGLKCTTDSCNSFGDGCEYAPINCSNGNPCDGTETCNPANGQCTSGSPISCDNGNDCDGIETCNTSTGECTFGPPIVCDDFISCLGEEYCNSATGSCQVSNQTGAACPVSGTKCNESGLVSGPSGNLTTLGPTNKFWLFDDGQREERYDLIEQLKNNNSDVTHASYATVLSDLNRTGDKVSWVTGTECYDWGYKFNSGDNWVGHWYPQGISGTASAYPTGQVEGNYVTLVSWYHKPEEDDATDDNKGARISFIRTTDSNNIKYRNILLVEPYEETYATGPVASFKPVVFHAGGIAWYKNLLYVADTSKGFRVFDMEKMMRVSTGSTSTIGCLPWNNNCQAYNYKYVIPMVARYRLKSDDCTASCCVRFAFAAMDLTTDPISVLSGEYEDDNKDARLHRWPLDSETGLMLEEDEIVRPTQVIYPNVKRMQGAVSVNNYFFVSSSEPKTSWPPTPGSLYFTYEYAQPITRGYPAWPEDLHYSSFSDRLWSCSEMPGMRYVFSVKRTHAIFGCD
jgi:hypothetical protein